MKRIEYVIDDLTMPLTNTACLNLVPKKAGTAIKFRPGQYGLISFLRGNVLSTERPFSFASSMLDSESKLQFGFRVYGKFTSEVANLQKGDSVFVRGPFGAFIYDEKKYNDTVFLAAGIGITPFLSAIRYASEAKLQNKLTLIYSNNLENEIPFYEELKTIESSNQNFKSYFLISKPAEGLNRQLFIPGRISKPIVLNALNNSVIGKTFFICGPEPFMVAAIDMLRELGVDEDNIKTEGFSQIPISFFEKGTGMFPLVAGTSALITLALFISINQTEITKAAVKSKDLALQQQLYEQQLAQNQLLQTQAQATDTQPVISTPEVSTTALQTPTVQQTTTQKTPTSPKIPRKSVNKPTTVTNTPQTTAIPPTVSTPEPVYSPPKAVYTPPVYVPPVQVTQPPLRTRAS